MEDEVLPNEEDTRRAALEARRAELLAQRESLLNSTALPASETPAPVPQQPAQEDGSVLGGVGAGIIRAPAQALGGLLDFAGDAGGLVGGGIRSVDQRFNRGRLSNAAAGVVQSDAFRVLQRATFQDENGRTNFSDAFANRGVINAAIGNDNGTQFAELGNNTANKITTDVGSVLVAFGGLRQLSGNALRSGATRIGAGARTAAVAEGTIIGGGGAELVLDPEEQNAFNAINSYLEAQGVEDVPAFLEYLAVEEDESVLESRIQQFVGGSIIGGTFEGLVIFGRAGWGVLRGNRAAVEAAEADIREVAENAINQVTEEAGETAAAVARGEIDSLDAATARSLDDDFARIRAREAEQPDLFDEIPAPSSTADNAAPDSSSPVSAAAGGGDTVSRTLNPEAASVDAPAPSATPPTQAVRTIDSDALARDLNALSERVGVELPEAFTGANIRRSGKEIIVPDELEAAIVARGGGASIISESGHAARVAAGNAPETVLTTGSAVSSREFVEDFIADVNSRGGQNAAEGIEGAARNASVVDTAGASRFVRYGDSDGVIAIARSVASQSDLSRGVLKDDDLQVAAASVADQIGLNPQEILDFASTVADQTERSIVHVRTVAALYERSVAAVDDTLRLLDDGGLEAASGESLEGAFAAIHNLTALANANFRIGTAQGRAFRARQLPNLDDYLSTLKSSDADEIAGRIARGETELPNLPFDRDSLRDWLENYRSTAGDPRGRQAFLRDALEVPSPGSFLLGSLSNSFVANILSGFHTLSLAAIAPAIVSPARTLAKTSGSLAVAARQGVNGQFAEASLSIARAGDAANSYRLAAFQSAQLGVAVAKALVRGDLAQSLAEVASTRSVSQAARNFGRRAINSIDTGTLAGRNAVGVLRSVGRGEGTLRTSARGSAIDTVTGSQVRNVQRQQATTAAGQGAYIAGNFLNAVLGRPVRTVLGTVDDISNRVALAGEAAFRLLDDVRAEGLTGQAARDEVQRRLLNTVQENGVFNSANRDIIGRASPSRSGGIGQRLDDVVNEAARTTLTNGRGALRNADNPQGRTLDRAGQGIINGLNNARDSFPALRVLLPVFNTPANGVGEALRATPLGFTFGRAREELAGLHGVAQQSEAHGRLIAAAGFASWGLYMAANNLLTGPTPPTQAGRDDWQQKGIQPFSIRLDPEGDWIDYSRLDAVGPIFGIIGALGSELTYVDDANAQSNAALTAVGALGEYFRDRAALQSVVDVVGANADSRGVGTLERQLRTSAANLAVPSWVNNFRNLNDQTARDPRTLTDAIFNRVPGASRLVPPRHNVLGQPVLIPRDTAIENFTPFVLSPSVGSTEAELNVSNELDRLYQATGAHPGGNVTGTLGRGQFRPDEVELTDITRPTESTTVESLFMENLGLVRDPDTGQSLIEALDSLIASPEYIDAVDADGSRKQVFDGDFTSKSSLVNSVYRDYKALARQATARQSEEAAEILAAATIKQGSSTAVEAFTVTDITTNPSILTDLGIDFQEFVARERGE